jgi:hypothetical protein
LCRINSAAGGRILKISIEINDLHFKLENPANLAQSMQYLLQLASKEWPVQVNQKAKK